MRQPNGLCQVGWLLALVGLSVMVPWTAAAETPWYGEATFGRAEGEGRLGATRGELIDDRSQAVAVALGYTLNRHLAIEAGYHDLGRYQGYGSPCPEGAHRCLERLATLGLCIEGADCTAAQVDVEAEITGFSLAAIPRWPLTERWSLRGKLGLISWESDVTALPGGGRIESFSGNDLVLGVGLQFDLPSGFGVVLEHDELDLDVRTTVVGVRWRF